MNTGSSWYNNTTCDTRISLVEDVGIPNFGVVSRTDGMYGLGSKVSSRWQCRVSSFGLIGYRTLWPLQHFVERAFSDGKTRILSRVSVNTLSQAVFDRAPLFRSVQRLWLPQATCTCKIGPICPPLIEDMLTRSCSNLLFCFQIIELQNL